MKSLLIKLSICVLIQGLICNQSSALNNSSDDTFIVGLSGGFVGTLFGLNQYGQGQLSNPKQIALGTFYGLTSGFLVGAGIDRLEIKSNISIHSEKLALSFLLGALPGAFMGSFIGFVSDSITISPDKSHFDYNYYHTTIGTGIGAIIGGSIWVMVTSLTEPIIIKKSRQMELTIGLIPESHLFYINSDEKPFLMAYRCVQINF